MQFMWNYIFDTLLMKKSDCKFTTYYNILCMFTHVSSYQWVHIGEFAVVNSVIEGVKKWAEWMEEHSFLLYIIFKWFCIIFIMRNLISFWKYSVCKAMLLYAYLETALIFFKGNHSWICIGYLWKGILKTDDSSCLSKEGAEGPVFGLRDEENGLFTVYSSIKFNLFLTKYMYYEFKWIKRKC